MTWVFFIETKGHVGEGHRPITPPGTGVPREGWEGVGDPLPPP